ncbi:unnamed protein product [Laminaria digitata]
MERAKFARVDTLAAALSCPLCFEMVKDCVVTPCGHSFCRSCAGDAVTRKHCCPVCQVGVIGGEAGLIRNFLVDEVTQTLRKATEETDVAYMRLLFENASSSAPSETPVPEPHQPPQPQPQPTPSSLQPPPPGVPPNLPTQSLPPPPPSPSGVTPNLQGQGELLQPRQEQQQQQQQQQHGGDTPGHPHTHALSPVEAVLVTRMRDAFLGYQAYYARERAAHEADVRSLTAQLETAQLEAKTGGGSSCCSETAATAATVTAMATVAAAAAGERRKGAVAGKVLALKAAIEDSRARFKAGMETLLRDFDAHAAAAAPPPSLLPSTVTVIVASRGVRFDTQLLPTHFPENVFNKVRAHYASSGDEVRGFGQDKRLYLQALSATRGGVGGDSVVGGGSAEQSPQIYPLDAAQKTVFSQSPGGRISAGWALVVDGAVLLASEEVKPCFAREYGREGKDPAELVDYFTCGECKLNWLCAACAAHCHGSCRDVKPFSLQHRPTWACCYCSKKKARIGCKLASGGEGGGT